WVAAHAAICRDLQPDEAQPTGLLHVGSTWQSWGQGFDSPQLHHFFPSTAHSDPIRCGIKVVPAFLTNLCEHRETITLDWFVIIGTRRSSRGLRLSPRKTMSRPRGLLAIVLTVNIATLTGLAHACTTTPTMTT